MGLFDFVMTIATFPHCIIVDFENTPSWRQFAETSQAEEVDFLSRMKRRIRRNDRKIKTLLVLEPSTSVKAPVHNDFCDGTLPKLDLKRETEGDDNLRSPKKMKTSTWSSDKLVRTLTLQRKIKKRKPRRASIRKKGQEHIFCNHCRRHFWAKPTVRSKNVRTLNHRCSPGSKRLQYVVGKTHRSCARDHEGPCLFTIFDDPSKKLPQQSKKMKSKHTLML